MIMKKVIKNVTLSIVTNDITEPEERVCFDGSLIVSNNWKKAAFAESAPKRPRARNTRVFEGEMLTTVAKPDGTFQMHTKNVNPLAVTDFPQRLYLDACAMVEKLTLRN